MNEVAVLTEGDHEEVDNNASGNPTLDSVIRSRLSRRDVLSGTAGAAAIAMLGGLKTETALADHADFDGEFFRHRGPRLDFAAVPKSLEDTVTVPRRYSYDVLYALGDPIAKGVPDYRNDGTDEAASFAHRAGDHHDGIQYFGLGPNGKYSPHSGDRGLLCMNHEAITPAFLHLTGPTIVGGVRTVPDEVLKEFYVHGVSIIEIEKKRERKRGSWSSAYDFFRTHARRSGTTSRARASIGESIR